MKTKTLAFLAQHPVFALHEFEGFLRTEGRPTGHNRKRLLSYHRKQGRIILIRPGLYASVPMGARAETYPVDSYLVAARLTEDAVLGYHTALEFQGVAHSTWQERLLVTANPLAKPFVFRGVTYRTISVPQALARQQREDFGVERRDRLGQGVRVTSLERTLVDLLDRPRLGGGWEEIWRSYEAVPYLDLEQVVKYALQLDNATTIAKVGFFLSENRDRWMVEDAHLASLRAQRPRQPRYLDRHRREHARLVKDWNLLAPERLLRRAWEDTDGLVA